jgi:hypothetical protein
MHIPERSIPGAKLNCLVLPMPPSPSTGAALTILSEAILGARLCQSMTAALKRRGATTAVSNSADQLELMLSFVKFQSRLIKEADQMLIVLIGIGCIYSEASKCLYRSFKCSWWLVGYGMSGT